MSWNSVRTGRPLAVSLALAAAILGQSAASAAASLPQLKTEVAFPNLKFFRPVSFAYPDDGSNLLFVVEQPGVIASFPNEKDTSDKVTFLDIRPQVNSKGNEEGLLGLTFHPKYKENGQFFVYYSMMKGNDRYSVVSRFKVSKDNPRKADPASEERVWISAKDPFENHNGGCTLFGPDGYLYISLGDSGGGGDPLNTGQNPKDWFASILRIDVDHPDAGKGYGIPKDNPRLRDPERFAEWAPEVYCIGLRNVWKFSWDRESGKLWAGEVGQNLWEMVHVIENGGNYGWSTMEAFHDFNKKMKVHKSSPISPPIVEYPHNLGLEGKRTDVGLSITGGYVYRGKALPELVGTYVYGDYVSGRIWGVRLGPDGKAAETGELIDVTKVKPVLAISAFGEDPQGELYILAFDGKIHRLVPR
jgi:glucose/arabinose dehydrogenase